MPDILDLVDTMSNADELKLTMDNEGRIYDRLKTLRTATISVACLSGRYDVEAAAKVFDSIVDQEARRYTKEFGVKINRAAKREVAREYARETKAAANRCLRDPNYCGDLPPAAVTALKSCKLTGGQLARSRRVRRRRR